MRIRSLAAALVCLCLAVPLAVPAAAEAPAGFSDVPETHWAYDAITALHACGMVQGMSVSGGSAVFRPEQPITRAQFLVLLVRRLFPDELAAAEPGAAWYSGAYELAVSAGLAEPALLPADSLNAAIERQEAAYLLAGAAALAGEQPAGPIAAYRIPDFDAIAPAFQTAVRTVYALGLLCGTDSRGTFCPGGALTRAQAAAALYRWIEPSARKSPANTALPVLMYHHVVPDGAACSIYAVTVSRLEEDFRYLSENGYAAVLPRELAAGMELPEKAVMITFDDGYVSNYELMYPLLQKYRLRAVIHVIVSKPDLGAPNYCSWDMLREMSASGLVEIGSHTYDLHKSAAGGSYDGARRNGVQRIAGESDAAFRARVLDDIQLSFDRLNEELNTPAVCFAYPYGAVDSASLALIESLFAVSLSTSRRTADLSDGLYLLPRWGISMDITPADVLE